MPPHRRLPPCTIATLLVCAIVAAIWLLVTQTAADADLWGHLRFGLDLLRTHHLPRWDTYSFTADRVWVNHEWLAEAAMAVAYRTAGAPGLNLLKMISIAIVAGIVLLAGRREGAPAGDRVLLAAFVVLATYTRTQVIRPQLFSVPLFCVILYAMSEAERQRDRLLIAVPLCFALWVNLHGAWIVGLACWSCWLAAAAWTMPSKRWLLLGLAVATALATLLNPYGAGLWRFLGGTVRLQRHDVTDWKPLLQLPPAIVVLDLMLPVAAACAVAIGRRSVPPAHLAIAGILAVGTWRVGRTDAFLEAAVGILFAPQILAAFASIRARLRSRVWEWTLPLGHAVGGAAAIAALTVGVLHLRTIAMEGPWLPDQFAVDAVRRACTGQKVLTWFDWGEYAIWHLSGDGIRVSMDGRRETVYSQRVIDDHNAFYNNEPSAIDYPDRISADCVWLPTRLAAVRGLEARGWTAVARTPLSVVFRRNGVTQDAPIAGVPTSPRRFPGP